MTKEILLEVDQFIHVIPPGRLNAAWKNLFEEVPNQWNKIKSETENEYSSEAKIRLTQQIWRVFNNAVKQYKATVDRDEFALPLEFKRLLSLAIHSRRVHRRHLRQRFDIDICRMKTYRSGQTIPPDLASKFVGILNDYACADLMFHQCLMAINEAKIEEKNLNGTLLDAVSAMRGAAFKGLIMIMGRGIDIDHDSWHDDAVFQLSGWIGAQIKKFGSIKKALQEKREISGQGGRSLSDILTQELPMLTLEAWHNNKWKEPKDILNEVSNVIRRKDSATRQKKEIVSDKLVQNARQGIQDDPLKNPATQVEFADLLWKEETYYAEQYERAKLSQDEEVAIRLQVLLQGKKYTNEQKAAMLAKTTESFKQDLYRARQKLQRAINQ